MTREEAYAHIGKLAEEHALILQAFGGVMTIVPHSYNMRSSLLVFAVFAVLAVAVSASRLHGDAKRKDLIEAVNNAGTTWRAGMNSRFAGKPYHSIKRQLGVIDENPPAWERLPLHVHTGFDMAALPEEFDARQQWPHCPTIGEIRDQSDCGSCWAFGAVEAASDRICIQTQGKTNLHLSAEDLLSCCSSCGFGCNGGYPSAAWQWFVSTGVVTGGNYGNYSWCSSYSMPNCDHHTTGKYPPCGASEYPTPQCPTQCDSKSTYPIPFAQDKRKFSRAYSVSSSPEQIQQEIMTNGPVEAAFSVYEDFPNYKSGVYQHVSGSYLGGHAIKILGWGVDKSTGKDVPYWLVANSWNEDWGDQGYFKILRGVNECGIEGSIVAGTYSG